MQRLRLIACAVFMVASSTTVWAQSRSFIPVEGANLQAKMETAARQARAASPPTRFWTAYSFDVRPGVAVDVEFIGDNGSVVVNGSFEGNVYLDGSAVLSFGSDVQTRNLGVFILREPERNTVARVEVFNLERRREYSRLPVYWLGRAANEESLNFLRGLITSSESSEVAADATRALALHDDERTGDILEELVRTSRVEKVRAQALSWLGRMPSTAARQAFLADLARNELESPEVRARAIGAFGQSRDAATLTTLVSLYNTLDDRDLKRRALASIARNANRDAAANFLLKVAATEGELGKKALAYLAELAVERTLGQKAGRGAADAQTELQREAVVAIGRRPREEAVPLLIKIARTHQKPEVRQQAFRLLGGTGDARALDFFREILAK